MVMGITKLVVAICILVVLNAFVPSDAMPLSIAAKERMEHLKKYDKVIPELTKAWHTPMKGRDYIPVMMRSRHLRSTPLDWECEYEQINDMFEENENRLLLQDLAALKGIATGSDDAKKQALQLEKLDMDEIIENFLDGDEGQNDKNNEHECRRPDGIQ